MVGTWHDPDLGRPIAAPRSDAPSCSASTCPSCARWPPRLRRTSAPTTPGSGTSCSWSASSFPTPRGRQALDDAGDRVAETEQHWSQLVGPARFDDACHALQELLDKLPGEQAGHETWPHAMPPHRQGSSTPMGKGRQRRQVCLRPPRHSAPQGRILSRRSCPGSSGAPCPPPCAAPVASPDELAFLDGAIRPALTLTPHRGVQDMSGRTAAPDEWRVPYATPVAIHLLPAPQS
jgi:hypothetical protein